MSDELDGKGDIRATSGFTKHEPHGMRRGHDVELLLQVRADRKRQPAVRGRLGDKAEAPQPRHGELLVPESTRSKTATLVPSVMIQIGPAA